eukprot:scaffold15914_cov80-Cylindrotheca_fusiformis.AAC.7
MQRNDAMTSGWRLLRNLGRETAKYGTGIIGIRIFSSFCYGILLPTKGGLEKLEMSPLEGQI